MFENNAIVELTAVLNSNICRTAQTIDEINDEQVKKIMIDYLLTLTFPEQTVKAVKLPKEKKVKTEIKGGNKESMENFVKGTKDFLNKISS